MAMKQDEFQSLVTRLEAYAQQNPAQYRLRVGLLAALGYAYIFSVVPIVAVLIGLLMLAGTHFPEWRLLINLVGISLGLLAYAGLRALWVRFSAPQGIQLTPKETPRLFKLIDHVTSALQTKPFGHVLLTDEFNAGVVQVPRLGPLGWQQNFLVLGLPLMHAMTPRQFSVVIAHELGHLSGNHGRFDGWVYRVRQSWTRLLDMLEREEPFGGFVFRAFFKWYAAVFNAYTFVLARANEYAADRRAAELAGARKVVETLINVKVKRRYMMEKIWPALFKEANHHMTPPPGTFNTLCRELGRDVDVNDEARWLDMELAEETTYDDTHPCLSERLGALGFPIDSHGDPEKTRARLPLPATASLSAAADFLGTAVSSYSSLLDKDWRLTITPEWSERYVRAQESLKRLQVLAASAETHPLTPEEVWERAYLTSELVGSEEAIPFVREVLAQDGDHPAANYMLGQVLLERNDETGIKHIERAMERHVDYVLSGCSLAYHFLMHQGKAREAEWFVERTARHEQLLERAQPERATITAEDHLEPHALSSRKLRRLCEQLYSYPLVGQAFLVRKAVSYFPERPCYFLGIVPRFAYFLFWSGAKDLESLPEQLASELDLEGDVLVSVNWRIRHLVPQIRRFNDAQIYSRSAWRKEPARSAHPLAGDWREVDSQGATS